LAGDCSGGSIAGIPENALTLVGDYRMPIGSGGLEWYVNAAGQYRSERAAYDRVVTAVVDTNWGISARPSSGWRRRELELRDLAEVF